MANLPSQIAPLTNNDKTKIIYPITKALAVNMENGSSVEQAVNDLNSNQWSLTGGVALTANTDLNTLGVGNYYSNTIITLVNSPFDTGFAGIVKVYNSAGTNNTYLKMEIHPYHTITGSWIRLKTGSGWTAWYKIPNIADINSINTSINTLNNKTITNGATTQISDANNATDINVIYFGSGTNFPDTTNAYYIRVIARTSNNIAQIAYRFNNSLSIDDVYVRQKNVSGVWSSWKKFVFQSAIDALNTTKTVVATISNVAIADHADTTIDVSSYRPDGYGLYSVNALVKTYGGGYYQLPWLDMPNSKTLYVFSLSNNQVTLKNVGTGWGTCTVYLTLFYGRQ